MTDRMLAEMTNNGKTVYPPIYTYFVEHPFTNKEDKIHTSPKVGFKPCYR